MTLKVDISSPRLPILLLMVSILFVFGATASVPNRSEKIDLYGHELMFSGFEFTSASSGGCFSEKTLQSTVEKLIKDNQFDVLLGQMNQYADELRMDDMAFLMMLNKVTQGLLRRESDDCKTIVKYVLLHKKGFDVFIGYTESSLTLYGRTNVMIDNCLFIERGTKKYFDLSFNQHAEPQSEQLFVMHHEGKALPLVMNTITPPAFCAKQSKKVMPFEYDGFLYFFTTRVNQSLVEYYKELPTINISTVYLNYGLSASATNSLVAEMKQATSSMSTTEGINFVLQFIQTTFEYKRDEQVYGQEKFSFPEETITNTYSDCEDKAMLFAVLVTKIFGLKTVALYYKNANHINVAVESWKQNTKGNFVLNDHSYVICEPTGTGFSVGENSTSMNLASLIDW